MLEIYRLPGMRHTEQGLLAGITSTLIGRFVPGEMDLRLGTDRRENSIE
jgi:hypothetical protein